MQLGSSVVLRTTQVLADGRFRDKHRLLPTPTPAPANPHPQSSANLRIAVSGLNCFSSTSHPPSLRPEPSPLLLLPPPHTPLSRFPSLSIVDSVVSGRSNVWLWPFQVRAVNWADLHSCQVRRSPIMSDKAQQPLPFVYQFAAGAVAGVSEVCPSPPMQKMFLFSIERIGRMIASRPPQNGNW